MKKKIYRIEASRIPIPELSSPNVEYKEFLPFEKVKRVVVRRYADGQVVVDIQYEEDELEAKS